MAKKVLLTELQPYVEPHDVLTKEEAEGISATLAEQIYDDMLDYLKSMQGWELVSGPPGFLQGVSYAGLDEVNWTREHYVKRSRLLSRREPHAMNAIRMYSSYGAAMRAELKSRDESAGNLWREKFWELPENRPTLGPHRRNRLDRRLLTDGELFFSLFPQPDGAVQIRLIDPLEIQDVFTTHPEDADKVIYYRRIRSTTGTGTNGQTPDTRAVYYRDLYATDEDVQSAKRAGLQLESNSTMAEANGQPVLIYHVPFQPLGLRGNGLLFSAISFIDNYRNFLQDRATIVRGLAMYIRKVVAKGGSKALSDLSSTIRSSIASGLGWENNPPDAVGSTYFENENLRMENTPPATNAGDARGDSRILRGPIGAGVGITEANLFGDPSVGNLASQVQMEGPQLRNFEDYQEIWRYVWQDLYNYVLDVNNFTGNRDIDIDFPPIIMEPLGEFVNIVMQASQQSFIPWEESARQILMRIGANNIDDLIETAKEEREEKKEEQRQQFGMSANGNGNGNGGEERNARRRGQQASPSGVPQQPGQINQREDDYTVDMSEHGVPVDDRCPFCEKETLWEAHGVRFCTSCQKSHNPKFVKAHSTLIADSETMFEDWSGPRPMGEPSPPYKSPKGLSAKGGARTKQTGSAYKWGVDMARDAERTWVKGGPKDREAGRVVDKDGNLLWENDRSEFADMIEVPDGVQLKGAIFTHYHPPIQYKGGKKHHGVEEGVSQPLSPSDVRWAVRHNLKETRCVGTWRGRTVVCRLVRRGRGWPQNFKYFLKDKYVRDHMEGYRSTMEGLDESDLTALSFEAFNDYWSELAASTKGVDYEIYEPYMY